MSTAIFSAAQPRSRTIADRRFYLAMALASAVLIFIGFARSYYLRSYFHPGPALSLLVHVHGFVFSLWLLYFVLQTALIAVRRPALHRSLGLAGAVLGTTMIVLGSVVAVVAMRLHHGTPLIDPETTFLVGLIDIGSFALFFFLGWIYRRNREAHQRLMLLAVIVGLTGAAIGRIVGYGASIPVMSLVNFGFLFAGPLYDLISRRRIHPVYVYGCLFALVTFTPLRFAVGATPAWHRMAHYLVGL